GAVREPAGGAAGSARDTCGGRGWVDPPRQGAPTGVTTGAGGARKRPRGCAGLASRRSRGSSRKGKSRADASEQALEQELELADLDLGVERVVQPVEDGDGQGAVVAVALELVDDPAVLDLALADADLELAGPLAGVAEVDVLDVRVDRVPLRVA